MGLTRKNNKRKWKRKKKITIAQKLGAQAEQKRKTRNEKSEKRTRVDLPKREYVWSIKNELEEVFRSLILENRDSSPMKQIRRRIQKFESISIDFKGGSCGGTGSSPLYRFCDNNRAPSLAHLNFYRHGSEQRGALNVSRPAIDWFSRWRPTYITYLFMGGWNKDHDVMKYCRCSFLFRSLWISF